MEKSYIERFKNGLNTASDSFAMLWTHPILFVYYLGLLLSYAFIFILAYNIIGYKGACLQFSSEFHAPQNNLLADLITHSGGLVYLGFIFSVFLNILLRTVLSVSLVQHTHALMHGHAASFKEIFTATKNRWFTILQWSLILGCGTFLISALSSLAENVQSVLLQASILSLGISWLLISFFAIPIIALTRKTVSPALYISIKLMLKYTLEILGGLFWIGLIYLFALLTNIAITEYLVPSHVKAVCAEHNFTFFNILFATILLVFKTRIFHQELSEPKTEDFIPDYSQF